MRKVLVIDDEAATLTMFRLFLGAYGYNVFVAENGTKGLDIFEKEKPRIVFTDIKMPGMNGFEVLKRIKEIDPMAEVIVITGHGDMDLAVEALNLEATDFINKPIGREALNSALGRAEERVKAAESQVNQISLWTEDSVNIMEVKGNLTWLSEKILFDAYEEISSKGAEKIVMKFDENCTINGAGMAILIQLLSETVKRNQTVAITGVPEHFRSVFEVVGVTKFAVIFDHTQAAINSLSSH